LQEPAFDRLTALLQGLLHAVELAVSANAALLTQQQQSSSMPEEPTVTEHIYVVECQAAHSSCFYQTNNCNRRYCCKQHLTARGTKQHAPMYFAGRMTPISTPSCLAATNLSCCLVLAVQQYITEHGPNELPASYMLGCQ
jgi:hypothetical protein